ncbi:MAG: PAS domain-containing protein [Phycisphaerae bacterium]
MDQDSRPQLTPFTPASALDCQNLLQTVIDAAAEHIILFDHQGTILAANRKARDFWEPQIGGSLPGRHGQELGPPELVDRRGKLCDQVVRTGTPVHFCDLCDGREMENVIHPVTDSAGEVRRVVVFSQDVTELRRSQRQVQARDAVLGALVDTIPDPIFYKDASFRYLGCNAAFAGFLGVAHDDIAGQTVHQLWDPEQAEVFATMDAELLRAGGTQRYDTKVRNAAGELRDILFTKATFSQTDGTPGGIIGVMTDITDRKRREAELQQVRSQLEKTVKEQTRDLREVNETLRQEVQERKRAEEALRSSQQFLEAALDSLEDPFFAKDDQHRWVLLNRRSCELMGHPREELIGKTDYDLFPPEEADVFWQNDLRAFQAGRLVEEEQITWQGRKYHISTSKNVYEDPESGRRFLVGTIRDITERIEAENRLLLSEQRLRAILTATPDLVFVVDAEGNYVDIFTSESHLLVEPAQELIGRNFRDVVPLDLVAQCEEALRRALHTDKPETFEYDLVGRSRPRSCGSSTRAGIMP